jgi:folate-binding protein YgfZ
LADGSVVEAPASLLDVIRVMQGMPTMGRELDESTIPAAARIVDRSVDFTKGCYVGQELVARIDSRGSNTPTRLVGVRFGRDSAPDAGGELLLDGAPAGRLTSVALSSHSGPIGLAYVKRAVEVPGTLDFQPRPGSSAPVEVVELPSPVARS